MNKSFLKIAAILGVLSVALGAFGAHALKQHLAADELAVFETAVRYQFYHAFALLAAGILFKEYSSKWIKYSGNFFITGIILFSGSLYLLTFLKANDIAGLNWVGAITPFGGLSFIIGWLCLFLAIRKK